MQLICGGEHPCNLLINSWKGGSMQFISRASRFVSLSPLMVVCCLLGCDTWSKPQPLRSTATLEICLVSDVAMPNSRPAIDTNSGATVYLILPAVVTAADVATVQRSEDTTQAPGLTFKLTSGGAQKLAAVNIPTAGRKMAIVANGEVIGTPTVRSGLSDSFQLSGGTLTHEREKIFDGLIK